tara:strand:+ start:15 stop:311 length:297 start_codon:yes stop_codon:yes gene_type:complete
MIEGYIYITMIKTINDQTIIEGFNECTNFKIILTRNVKKVDHNTYLDKGGKLIKIQLQKVRLNKKEYKYDFKNFPYNQYDISDVVYLLLHNSLKELRE